LYEPVWTSGFVSAFDQILGRFNQYIVVKVDDEPARTPPLDEIRDEVVRTYKRVKARELAMNAAKELAKKAEGQQQSLSEQFAQSADGASEAEGERDGRQVVESDPFAWFDVSLNQFDPRFHLGEPFGVEHVGPAFLETVFALEPGGVDTAWNHDQSTAYVVRLVRHERSEDALRNEFLQEADRYQERAATDTLRHRQLSQALIGDVFEEAGVDWQITPDLPPDAS
jgi:hypothetical protein